MSWFFKPAEEDEYYTDEEEQGEAYEKEDKQSVDDDEQDAKQEEPTSEHTEEGDEENGVKDDDDESSGGAVVSSSPQNGHHHHDLLTVPKDVQVLNEASLVGRAEEEGGNRSRADSGITFPDGDNDQNDGDEDEDKDALEAETAPTTSDSEYEDEEEEDQVTSDSEKQSLLVLAAEHDRVDILQAILNNNNSDAAEGSASAATLLRGGDTGIPPLHTAVSYGSVNATNCLLRIGADPSIRPNVQEIKDSSSSEQQQAIPNLQRFDGKSAWELVFGKGEEEEAAKSSSMFWGRKSSSDVVDIPPSKREGIRHAFTSEALRCIGSDDDAERLQQLLASGMPSSIDIGGKNLGEWAQEMNATKCRQLLLGPEAPPEGEETKEVAVDGVAPITPPRTRSHVLNRPPSASKMEVQAGENDQGRTAEENGGAVQNKPADPTHAWSLQDLLNRIDELESLARALSLSLDGLAEEASVCNGLLWLGNASTSGASALASHVRSLKATRENKQAQAERLAESIDQAHDELEYWKQQLPKGQAEKLLEAICKRSLVQSPEPWKRQFSFSADDDADDEALAQQRRQQVRAQIAASENKITKLRAAIADLSEVCARDLDEVEIRGLSGGVNLVREIRDEIRDLDFTLSQLKNQEATCRAQIQRLQEEHQRIRREQAPVKDTVDGRGSSKVDVDEAPPVGERDPTPQESGGDSSAATSNSQSAEPKSPDNLVDEPDDESDHEQALRAAAAAIQESAERNANSQKIASGDSTALALRHQKRGFFPVSLWQILLRIIGLGGGAQQAAAAGAAVATVAAAASANSRPHHPGEQRPQQTVTQPVLLL